MLRGLDPLLTPDLLFALASAGHGDRIAIVDANFPAVSMARRLIPLHGANATAALVAVLSVLPVDDFEPDPVVVMAVVGDPAPTPEAVADFTRVLAGAGLRRHATRLPRHDFYRAVTEAFAVVHTGERRSLRQHHAHQGRGDVMRVDAHHHVWRLDRGDYGWLTPDLPIHRDYGLDDLRPLAGRHHCNACWCRRRRPMRRRSSCWSGARVGRAGARRGRLDGSCRGGRARCNRPLAGDPLLKGLRPMLQDIPGHRLDSAPRSAAGPG